MSRMPSALLVSWLGLADPVVVGGDRLSLRRRAVRLQKRFSGAPLRRLRAVLHQLVQVEASAATGTPTPPEGGPQTEDAGRGVVEQEQKRRTSSVDSLPHQSYSTALASEVLHSVLLGKQGLPTASRRGLSPAPFPALQQQLGIAETVTRSVWSCPACTLTNSCAQDKCRMCRTPSQLLRAAAGPRGDVPPFLSPQLDPSHTAQPHGPAHLEPSSLSSSPSPSTPSVLTTAASAARASGGGAAAVVGVETAGAAANAAHVAHVVPVTAFTSVLRTLVPRPCECVSRSMEGVPLNRQTGEHSRFLGIDTDHSSHLTARAGGTSCDSDEEDVVATSDWGDTSQLHVDAFFVVSCPGVRVPASWLQTCRAAQLQARESRSGRQQQSSASVGRPHVVAGGSSGRGAAEGPDIAADVVMAASEECIVGVEELALQHYSLRCQGGWLGAHCEGGVFYTLFGLLMWPVLFAPVKNAFFSPCVAPFPFLSFPFLPCHICLHRQP